MFHTTHQTRRTLRQWQWALTLIVILSAAVAHAQRQEQPMVEVSLLREVAGKLLLGDEPFNGWAQKKMFRVKVRDGVIKHLEMMHEGERDLSIPVNNNRFDGEGTIKHQKQGLVRVSYRNGFLTHLTLADGEERWEKGIFFQGTGTNGQYFGISKVPHFVLFEGLALDVVGQLLERPTDLTDISRFRSLRGDETLVLDNGTLRTVIENISELGAKFVLSCDHDQPVRMMLFDFDFDHVLESRFSGELLQSIGFYNGGPAYEERYVDGLFVAGTSLQGGKNRVEPVRSWHDKLNIELNDSGRLRAAYDICIIGP